MIEKQKCVNIYYILKFKSMESKENVIRLTEQEFNQLIEEAVKQVISEGKFGNFARKVGKGIGKAALYGALGAGSLWSIDQGLQNQEKYEQEMNRQAMEMQYPTDNDVTKWIEDHKMEDTPENREYAWKELSGMNESKKHDRLARIIREEISKVI